MQDAIECAKYVMGRGYLPVEKLFDRFHIYGWERKYLIEFIRRQRGLIRGVEDFKFEMDTAGTTCGTAGCIGGYVWKAACRDAEAGLPDAIMVTGTPHAYVVRFAQHSGWLQELYFAHSLADAAAREESEFRYQDITAEEAADAAERTLQGKSPIWLPGTATVNFREIAN